MMRLRFFLTVMLSAGALLSGGCVTGAAHSMPAVLASGDEETVTALKTVLADALNRSDVILGAGDPTKTPVIAVQPHKPSRYEDRSLARPILFDIELRGGACVAVRRDTGEAFDLTGVACRAYGG